MAFAIALVALALVASPLSAQQGTSDVRGQVTIRREPCSPARR
jgi:hypothetical protein